MQKNNLTLHNAASPEWKLISLLTLATLTQWLKRTSAIQTLKKCYADIMGIKLTSEQTVYVSYAQIASVLTLMPFNINLGCAPSSLCASALWSSSRALHKPFTTTEHNFTITTHHRPGYVLILNVGEQTRACNK